MQRFQRHNSGTSHWYSLDGERIPGVTTICGILDKPALVNWAAEQSADWVVNHQDSIGGMPVAQLHKAVVAARFHANKKAVVRGNRVHALAARIQAGEEVEVPDELAGPVEAFARWLDQVDATGLYQESPVCHTGYRYGGTLDAIIDTPQWGRLLVDIKTGKNAYSEVGLQLAAYRHADVLLEEEEQVGPRGGRKPSLWHEHPVPTVDGCAVLHLPEGADTVSVLPVRADEHVFESFLYMLEVYDRWVTRTDWRERDNPGHMQIVGAAVFPEDAWPDMSAAS